MMKNIFDNFYQNAIFEKIYHTLVYSLKKELFDCQRVLDIGCGPDSPIRYCRNIKYSLGIEPFKPYLEQAKKRKTHIEYLNKRIEELDFPQKSFDAVILIEVLEHLPHEEGLKILKKTQKWARKKVIVSTPNGFLAQKELDGNELQRHLSGWSASDFKKLGFQVTGRAGLKFLRDQSVHETMFAGLTTSIKYRPKFFWFMIAVISQVFVYFLPDFAYGLFCVKNIQWKK